MFSDVYRRVTHFGQWADETADAYGRRDAFEVLQAAAQACAEAEQRTPEVRAALDFLKPFATRPALVERFWGALAHPDPAARQAAATAALALLARHIPG
jgi:hypothetical protein